MININDYTNIGKIIKTHGYKGNLICELNFNLKNWKDFNYIFLMINNYLVPFYIEKITHSTNKTIIVKFEDINNINEALKYKNNNIYLSSNKIIKNISYKESFKLLYGFTAISNNNNIKIGTIEKISNYSNNIVITIINNNEEILIPLNNNFIVDIIEEKKQIILKIPEGLLDIYKN